MNRSNAGTTLTPGTRIGLIRSATLHNAVKVDVNLHDIMVNIVDKGGECILKGDQEHFADVFARLDLAGSETQTDMDKARAIFAKHIKVSPSSDGDLGCTDAVKHRITTTDDRPVSQPYRRVLPTQLDEVKEPLEKLLRTGGIVPRHSDHASPIVLVRKISGALRMCIDYRLLNILKLLIYEIGNTCF